MLNGNKEGVFAEVPQAIICERKWPIIQENIIITVCIKLKDLQTNTVI